MWQSKWAAALVSVAWLAVAQAARVEQVVPQGEVAVVRQVQVRFDTAVVPAGDPRAAAPFALRCNGQTPQGSGRWLDARRWVFDLTDALGAGQRCVLERIASWQPLTGEFSGSARFEFSTGAPAVTDVRPSAWAPIDEEQHFLVRSNGAVDSASVERHARCEVEGLGERLTVQVVGGEIRQRVLKSQGRDAAMSDPTLLLLKCQRPFAAGSKVRLVWGAGIAAAADASLRVKREQRFEWTVRPRFLAEFSCERENARAACLPLRPLSLRFNAPVPRALALAVRLEPLNAGPARAPGADDAERSATLTGVDFAPPFAENQRFRLVLPPGLVDEAGRSLANAASFPLEVAIGALPPLAKFSAAPFAVIEAPLPPSKEPALLPMALRQVGVDLAGASATGALRTLHLGPATADTTLLEWIAKLQRDHEDQWRTRSQPMLAQQVQSRRQPLPPPRPEDSRATVLIGVPLAERGLHIVEAESQILGAALLETPGPLHARTAALVSQLGVHFKRGRASSLVWVTTLDRARPVPGARVAVNDCRGRELWSGSTDAQGLALIPRGFDESWDDEGEGGDAPTAAQQRRPGCISRDGLMVTARARLDGIDELGLVFSRWQRGIEPWRFGIRTAEGTVPDRRAHTVFSRNLLRAGDELHMKHFVRDEVARGLARVPAAELPTEVIVRHVGSDTAVRLPITVADWAGGRSAESRWKVPSGAALGLYDVALQRGEQRLFSGSFRVEAFRVPLVDAQLRLPGSVTEPVAPRELKLQAQLSALAGGPLRDTPLLLNALLQPRALRFDGFDDFSFSPPQAERPNGAEAADDENNAKARVVASKLAGRTGADGRAGFDIQALPALDGPSELQAEASFIDLNGETQTISRRVPLWPASVVVGLRVPGWASVRGSIFATAVVLDTRGKALAGRELRVLARQRTVLSTRTRIVGGFYSYDNRVQVKELGAVCQGRSDARGRLECRIEQSALQGASGELELVAEARDDSGRASRAAASAWLAGSDEAWFAQDDDDRIDLLPESREVEPGQSVRMQLRLPFRQATALVTVEREGIVSAQLVQVSARDPVITVKVPEATDEKSAAWSPNVVVSALVLRGRLREAPWWSFFTWGWRQPGDWWQAFRDETPDWKAPSATVDLAKPSFRMAATELKVGRRAQRLDVVVQVPQRSPQQQWRVRQTVPVSLRVSQGGRPVAGTEVAFVAVDEGLLALAPNTSWELLEGLLAPRPWGVVTATAQGEIVGRRHHGRKALPAGGGGGANATRELFDTLLLWRGRVALDANGEARIELPLNDSLTRFRLVAVADDGQGRFGLGQTTLTVTQDLQLQSGLPLIVRGGDEIEAGFTLRNGTARAMNLRVSLVAVLEGNAGVSPPPALPALPPQTVALAAGASQALQWRVAVPQAATRLRWTASAEETGATAGTAAQDRIEITQPVLAAVPPRVWQASLQALPADGLAIPVAPPEGALPGSAQLRATLAPSLGVALPALQDWFRRYPFNCLEQSSSRALALGDRVALERIAAELPAHLDDDGLAGWFPGARMGDDKLTAYLVSAAHEAGHEWPAASRERMLAGLAAFVEGRIERTTARSSEGLRLDVRRLAALEALARHGRVVPRMLGPIAWTPAVWPTSALLDAWSLHRRVAMLPQRDSRLAELQNLVRSRLVAGGTTLRFSTEEQDRWWWLMEGPDANAARLVLLATDDSAWRNELPNLLTAALARQRSGAWSTTTANLWGVLALQRFVQRVEAAPVAGRSLLRLGTVERTLEWSGSTAPSVALEALPLTAPATVQARHEGRGAPWLTLQSWAAVPLARELSAGYRLTRRVEAVQQQKPGVFSRGDVLRVTLEVESPQDLGWVVLADPLPAGAVVLGSGLGRDSALALRGATAADSTEPVWQERAADAWRGYFDALPRGRHRVSYTLRLNTAGRFSLPPTRVEAMYAPENFAELPLAVVEVQP